MGGVVKVDQLISFYRTFIRSRKWTLQMIVHAIDLIIKNFWLKYMKDAEHFKKCKKDLFQFRKNPIDNFIRVERTLTTKKKRRQCKNRNEN